MPGYVVDERALMAEAMKAAAQISGVPVEQGRAFMAALRQCLEECRRRHLRQARNKTTGANEARRRFNR
jgi:hypothetical protein